MQIKISGETPFQVLGTTFTVGPSESGYDLMFSADGQSYSKLFSVGANTNRQVTQVAAGSYYFLSGNTSELTVNWFANCVSEGSGGGGSYVLPVASDSTLGGIKVGSGLSIDANGVLSTSGGTGVETKYKVVEELPESGTPGEIVALVDNGTKYYSTDNISPDENNEGKFHCTLYDENVEGYAEATMERDSNWCEWRTAYINMTDDYGDFENGEGLGRFEYMFTGEKVDNGEGGWNLRGNLIIRNFEYTNYKCEGWEPDFSVDDISSGSEIIFDSTTDSFRPVLYIYDEYNAMWKEMDNRTYIDFDKVLDDDAMEDFVSELYSYAYDWKTTYLWYYGEHSVKRLYKIRSLSNEVWFSSDEPSEEPSTVNIDTWYIPFDGSELYHYSDTNIGGFPQGEGIGIGIDDYGYIDMDGYWGDLANVARPALTHRIVTRHITEFENPDNQEDIWNFENNNVIFDYYRDVEVYSDDGEGNVEYRWRSYFSSNVIISGVSYTGRWAVWDGQWDEETPIAPIYWGLTDGEYIDINIDVTDWQTPEICQNFDGESGYAWGDVSIGRFGAALLGVEGYKLSEKPIHIHYWEYDDGNDEWVPVEGNPAEFTQYATIDKILVENFDDRNVEFRAKFKLAYNEDNLREENLLPEYSFAASVDFLTPGEEYEGGQMEIYEQGTFSGLTSTLIAENAWIQLDDYDDSFDSASSVMSLRKFADAVMLGKAAHFAFRWFDVEYGYLKMGQILGFNGYHQNNTSIDMNTSKGGGGGTSNLIVLHIRYTNGEFTIGRT